MLSFVPKFAEVGVVAFPVVVTGVILLKASL